MTAPENPKPHESNDTLDTIFEKSMEKIREDFLGQSKRLINSLTYGSYHSNRNYGMSAETYAKMMNWNETTAQAYEAAYRANMEQQREDERYKRLLRDLELIEDENDFLNQ